MVIVLTASNAWVEFVQLVVDREQRVLPTLIVSQQLIFVVHQILSVASLVTAVQIVVVAVLIVSVRSVVVRKANWDKLVPLALLTIALAVAVILANEHRVVYHLVYTAVLPARIVLQTYPGVGQVVVVSSRKVLNAMLIKVVPVTIIVLTMSAPPDWGTLGTVAWRMRIASRAYIVITELVHPEASYN